ncbi:MAG: hypothetical protein U5M51_16025 [Emticicia sp.]|nr:hypothetical protein [Emticicia sp.]
MRTGKQLFISKGTKGNLVKRATILDVYIWKPERKENIESVQLIISTEADGSEVKRNAALYSLCYNHEGKMELKTAMLKTALYRQMQRFWRERAFQNAKSDRRSGTIRTKSVSGTFMERLVSSYCFNDDGSTFYLRDSTRK